MIDRIKVIVTALPTYLAIFAVAAPIIAEEAAEVLPSPWSEKVTAIILGAAGVALAAIETIRRLTPVVSSQRGLLPPD